MTSEMGACDMPVIIFGLHEECKGVCNSIIEAFGDGFNLQSAEREGGYIPVQG